MSEPQNFTSTSTIGTDWLKARHTAILAAVDIRLTHIVRCIDIDDRQKAKHGIEDMRRHLQSDFDMLHTAIFNP